jgi:2-polyprenyl-3-methyl-5-hydroxy-6-metoxy-1,4-benzoquinol methylase
MENVEVKQLKQKNCRFCNAQLRKIFVSLGSSPLSNSYLSREQLQEREEFYPLEAYVCEDCFLVQLREFEAPADIFSDYAYFSSYSDTWLKHAREYVEKIVPLLNIGRNSLVVEVASNDGYLLQYFAAQGIPVLGIEPARNVAEVAIKKNIPTETFFFGVELANRLVSESKSADLIIGNNVLAHVPDINDFVAGLKIILKPNGVITMEFPHLMDLIDKVQFDTIYHEHLSYFSFLTVKRIFGAHGLTIFDVEGLATHGGSLRIYARHGDNPVIKVSPRVLELEQREIKAGYTGMEVYLNFKDKVKQAKRDILDFLISAKRENKVIVGYGAPAKGNTLLNYCGIRDDFIDYTVDRSPHKQGRYLPGTRIFIDKPEKIRETKPDYVFILPWNIKDEIMEQMSFIRQWGGKFVIPIPKISIA